LLCAGRLVSDKGIDTAIKAMTKLVFEKGQLDVRLSLAGSGSTDYEKYLRSLVNQAGLTDYVSFLGWVPPEEMPELLRKFDVLLVPSIWPEPLARVVLEGMSSGLVVVATPTGGTREILTDGQNGLLFAPDDAEELAQKIVRLADDSDLRRNLAMAGQQTVAERFTVTKMLDEIESYLQEIALASPQKEAN
jgi:glycosyltransferase involved in cell wall biosynthesis